MRRTVAAVAVAPLLLAAGCSSGGDSDAAPGSQAPAVSASPSESVSPATQAPTTQDPTTPAAEPSPTVEPWELVELPDRGPTVPGVDLERAKNAATVLLAAYAGGLQNGSTENLEKLSDEDCVYCKKQIRDIRDRVAAGVHLSEDFAWSAPELYSGPPLEGEEYHLVLMRIETTDWLYLDEAGELVDTEPAESGRLFVAVRRTNDGWLVSEVSAPDDQEWANVLSLMEQ